MAKKKNLKVYQDAWIKAYDDGQSLRQIADAYGVDRSSVARLIKEQRDIRHKGTSDEVIQQIGDLYVMGLSKAEVARQVGLSASVIGKLLEKHHGIEVESTRRQFEHLLPEMIARYEAGESLTEIGEALHLSRNTVHIYLERAEVERRSYEVSSRYYEFQDDYFDTIGEKQSWSLGVIWGLGHLYEDSHRSRIFLRFHESLIPELSTWIQTFSDREEVSFNSVGNMNRLTAKTYEYIIYSSKWKQQLIGWGFPLGFPSPTSVDMAAFWRGYVFARGTLHRNREALYIGFESTEMRLAFLTYLKSEGLTPPHHKVHTKSDVAVGFTILQKEVLRECLRLFPSLKEQALAEVDASTAFSWIFNL